MESVTSNHNQNSLKAIIIGASGATGRELTDLLVNSEHYSDVFVIVRRNIDRWDIYNETQKQKLKILKSENLDILGKTKDEIISTLGNDFSGVSSVFCCLGSRVGRGLEEFTKVDHDYVLYSASLCEKFNIPHYSTVSTTGADASSWFAYMRIKGQADEDVMVLNLPYTSVFRPGGILDRDNDWRFGEFILKIVPFVPKLKATELAKALMIDDLDYHFKRKDLKGNKIFSHKEILNLVKNDKI
jgi:hypothetical protein